MTTKNSLRLERASGILLHIYSLPSKYGIGTFGEKAYRFVDFLEEAGQAYWQILPLGHTGFGDSPYQCYSSVAGNPFFIDLDFLAEEGFLDYNYLNCLNPYDDNRVDFGRISVERYRILKIAFDQASRMGKAQEKIKKFEEENGDWLEDYAMFMAVRNLFGQKPVWQWEDERIKRRSPEAIQYYKKILKDDIDFYKFIQALFFEQWDSLKSYANQKNVKIIGDIPIYVSPDSVEVWKNPELFQVDKDLVCKEVAGVPPDYYSETGQVWGNPVYNWKEHKKTNYSWWIDRIRHTLKIADVIRLDHFRGFQAFWSIPNGEETAINGEWKDGPKMDLFNAIKNELGDVPFIAEDLGIITDDVRELLKKTGFPGMRVMIYGLHENEDNMHLPHNWDRNVIGYTSTHDSETFAQMVFENSNNQDRTFAMDYINALNYNEIGIYAIRSAFASPAIITITTMQDVLSLESESRMNMPSTLGGNWSWRVSSNVLTHELAKKICKITKTYKRLVKQDAF